MNVLRTHAGPKRRRTIALASAAGAAFGLFLWAGLGSMTAGAAEHPTIRIENFSFAPDVLTVPVGATVTWVNGDDIPHSVVLADKSYRSKALDTGDKATFTFTKAGEVTYFCGLHPRMTGKIIVNP